MQFLLRAAGSPAFCVSAGCLDFFGCIHDKRARVDYGWNAYADHRTAHSLPADFFATVSHARSGHDARVADLNRRAESLDVLCGKGIDGENHIGPRQGNHFVYQFCGFKSGYTGDRGVETAHI